MDVVLYIGCGSVFEEYLNKKVRVVQKDGFVKYGVLIFEDSAFIKIEFEDGLPRAIAISNIASLDPDRVK